MEKQITKESIVVNTPAQLDKCLTYLSEHTTGSTQKVLETQLQVIKFVQNHSLLNAPIDTLFQCTQEALEEAKTEYEVEVTKKNLAAIIQNFVFMLDARLQYAKDKHNEEKWELIEKATNAMAKTAVAVGIGALSGGAAGALFGGLKSVMPASCIKTDIDNVVDAGGEAIENGILGAEIGTLASATYSLIRLGDHFSPKKGKEGKKSIISEVVSAACSFFKNDDKIEKDSREFNEFLVILFTKLVDNNKLIGKDYRISGMIKNYSEDIVRYQFKDERELEKNTIKNLEEEIKDIQGKPLYINLAVGGFGVFVFIIRGIWNFICSIGNTIVDAVKDTETVSEPWMETHLLATMAILAAVVAIGQFIVHLKKKDLQAQIEDHKENLKIIDNKVEKLRSDLTEYSRIFNPNF